MPPRLPLSEEIIQPYLDRRKPGQSRFVTQRREDDEGEILAGVFEGMTTGTPVTMLILNKDQRSKDYNEISRQFRPGHADFTYQEKYGIRDYRGGGRSSARETAVRVAAGAIADAVWDQFEAVAIEDSAQIARAVWQAHGDTLGDSIQHALNARRLLAVPELAADVDCCLQRDIFDRIVRLDGDGWVH